MLSFTNKIAFLGFALTTVIFGTYGFYRLYRRVRRGVPDTDLRLDALPRRIAYAITTTLLQNRTFRKRPWISFFHSLIFYGFVFYLAVNLVDALEGFVRFNLSSTTSLAKIYNLSADVLSGLVLLGVIALVVRRFFLPSRRDFLFNQRTLLQQEIKSGFILQDSLIVSAFILFHVGSRAVGAGAKLLIEGPDRWQPFATVISRGLPVSHAEGLRVFGYWGALGSVLAFLIYFPRSKHVHIFMAPLKYLVAREASSGVLPAVNFNVEVDEPQLGAKVLEDFAWPRLLDAYACIQCNRCQDVCPATATGKSLSPSALEINKRMELNKMTQSGSAFEDGAPSPNPLLSFALSPEAAWACTTCGACMQVCPVQDEPMLDIVDIRRQQVMMEGEFPAQLQTAFRGMERSQNPWGINHAKRLDWAEGLNVKTTDENPEPDVLFWVGCAASYDPQSQKTARAFVQLLDHAGVDFAVLGKRECCTGDTARRAGNEYLYRQLAETNVATLNEVKPKLIVATCPHCMNTVGKEYKQLGGEYKVIHHTEYLQRLVADGRIKPETSGATVTYHDPCYLGRHNGVYDAPRNLLNVLSNNVVELDRTRENAFCCGAGGAQFWKEEEAGEQRISDNRFAEVKTTLASATEKVLAVGCPFCKSMLQSTPEKTDDEIAIRDVAELLWEGVQRRSTTPDLLPLSGLIRSSVGQTVNVVSERQAERNAQPVLVSSAPAPPQVAELSTPGTIAEVPPSAPERKKWNAGPKVVAAPQAPTSSPVASAPAALEMTGVDASAGRKKWPKRLSSTVGDSPLRSPSEVDLVQQENNSLKVDAVLPLPIELVTPVEQPDVSLNKRKTWKPKG